MGRGTVTAAGRSPGGRKYDTTEPTLGKSDRERWLRGTARLGAPGLPLSMYCTLGLWLLLGCVSDRTIAYLSARRASRGNFSQMSMPGTLVLMDLNSPRTSYSAPGLRSDVSCCGGPPHRNRSMHESAERVCGAASDFSARA